MTEIEYFEPFQDDFGIEVPSPEWLVVRAQLFEGFAWDDHSLYLAFHDPIIGFVTVRKELLHNVTHFSITDIPIDL